jgi:hypothetical protein
MLNAYGIFIFTHVLCSYFCQLLNIHGVNDVRQTEIHTAEPLVPEPSNSEVEIAIEKV